MILWYICKRSERYHISYTLALGNIVLHVQPFLMILKCMCKRSERYHITCIPYVMFALLRDIVLHVKTILKMTSALNDQKYESQRKSQ